MQQLILEIVGGPLINSLGEVIGVNTIKITSADNIGFSVPINVVKPIIEKIKSNENFEEAYLGLFAYDKDVIPYFNNNSLDFKNGIYVAQIALDGPSANSGLVIGDIISQIDDKNVSTMNELKSYIYSKNPGDTVRLTIVRNNKNHFIDITLGKKS